jgi:hypothetical protein
MLKIIIPVVILLLIIGVALNFSKISKYFGLMDKEEEEIIEED